MKKTLKMFVATGLVGLTWTSAAHAGSKVLASAPAPLTGSQTMYCDVTNIDPVNPKDVTTEIVDINNNTVTGPTTATIAPNSGGFLGSAAPAAAWCRFTVTGSTKNLRAIAVYDNGTGYTMSLPAY